MRGKAFAVLAVLATIAAPGIAAALGSPAVRVLRILILALAAMLCVTRTPAVAATLRMVIQSHANLGARCLDTPNGQSTPGIRLQMWDCGRVPSQVLVYDDQTLELKMGSFCVTSWGRGDSQDAVGLDVCDGSASEHWKMAAVQDYYQIIGVNGRCLNLRYAAKDNSAPVQIYDCAANDVASLWALVEAPPAASEAAACQTDGYSFSVPDSRSGTANSVTTGGAACIYTPHPRPEVQWTSVSITERPKNGTFEQTAEFEFKYQPNPGFKGQDETAIKACGHSTDHSGCATVTYRITVN